MERGVVLVLAHQDVREELRTRKTTLDHAIRERADRLVAAARTLHFDPCELLDEELGRDQFEHLARLLADPPLHAVARGASLLMLRWPEFGPPARKMRW